MFQLVLYFSHNTLALSFYKDIFLTLPNSTKTTSFQQLALSLLCLTAITVNEPGKRFTGQTYKLCLSFTVISDVYMSFFQIKLHILSTALLSGFQRSFKIYWARKYLANVAVQAGKINANVYKTELFFTSLGHGKLPYFLHYYHTAYNRELMITKIMIRIPGLCRLKLCKFKSHCV